MAPLTTLSQLREVRESKLTTKCPLTNVADEEHVVTLDEAGRSRHPAGARCVSGRQARLLSEQQ